MIPKLVLFFSQPSLISFKRDKDMSNFFHQKFNIYKLMINTELQMPARTMQNWPLYS